MAKTISATCGTLFEAAFLARRKKLTIVIDSPLRLLHVAISMRHQNTKPRRRANLAAYHRRIALQPLISAAATITITAALIGWLIK